MSTAIIVSGSLRHLINASSSWTIPGDYFLIVDEKIYTTGNMVPTGNSFDIIAETIKKSKVEFSSVFICMDSGLPDEIPDYHSSANMINKWKLAYYNILPYHQIRKYERFILLRPDLYLHRTSERLGLLDILPEDDTVYGTTKIKSKSTPPYGERDIMSDVLLMCNLQTLYRISHELSDYYIENYDDTLFNGYDVHMMMAKFMNEKSIRVLDDLDQDLQWTVLRDNCNDLFYEGLLRHGVDFKMLKDRSIHWWNQRHGL
jgi:hypothetical protein